MKNMVKRTPFAFPALCCILGCGGGSDTTAPSKVVAIEVLPKTGQVPVGGTLQIQATARNAKGDAVTLASPVWTTSNREVATVSQTGMVTGVGPGGPVSIIVAADGQTATAILEVTVSRLAIDAPPGTLTALGDTKQLVATAFDVNNARTALPALTWSSSDATVVEVTQAGLATARRNGVATITANAGPTSAQIQLTVQQVVASVQITATSNFIKAVGASVALTAALRDKNGSAITGRQIAWSTSNASVATVSSTGLVKTTGFGQAEIVASVDQTIGRWAFEVSTEMRVPVDPYLATPIAGALWEIPVVIVEFLPTADGVNLDVTKNPDFYTLGETTLDALEKRILDFAKRRKMGIEQGSRFRGYRDPLAAPSLGYRVVDHIIVYELTPASTKRGREAGGPYYPDFFKIFARLKLDQLITEKKVKEVWIVESGMDAGYPSYNPAIHKQEDFRTNWESNMSSPTTGDVSNSDRDPNDLPVLGHTYVVYTFNFRRTQAEAIHNVGHQLEALLSYVNQRQDGDLNLFWHQFVGQNAQNQFITGRAGWTHMPPNTTTDYDYLNPTLVSSDIEDWRPDASGSKKSVNVSTWGSLTYPWPGAADFEQRAETQWYVYWMQNFPGRSNQIRRGTNWMTNWWAFTGDWDAAIRSGLGLYGASQAAAMGSGGTFRFDSPSEAFSASPEKSPKRLHKP